ncbi:MAG: flagellar assembly lytic transglycosylase [Spirochaetota bacterium]
MRFVFLILISVITVSGCAEQGQVWGIPQETFSQRLQREDHDFLRQLDYDELDLEEVFLLRPGAAFYLSEVYADLELSEMRRKMLRLELETGEDPWRHRAVETLLSDLEADERYEELASVAQQALEIYPDDEQFRFARYTAMYEQGQDEALLEGFRGEEPALKPFLDADPFDDRRREAELWRAVSSYRTRSSEWQEHVRSFFVDLPAAPQHGRLYLFLIGRSRAQEPFSNEELSLFRAKARLGEGEFDEAATIFREQAEGGEAPQEIAGLPVTHWLVRDMGLAFLRAGLWTRGGDILEGYAETSSEGELRARAFEYAGRVYRASGDHQTAARRFEQALEAFENVEERRRQLWYLIDARIDFAPGNAVEAFDRYPDVPLSDSYFDRLLDRLASVLVRDQLWEELAPAADQLERAGLIEASDQFDFLAAEAALQGKDGAGDASAAAARLERVQTEPYYRLLAAVRLGETDTLIAPAPGPEEKVEEREAENDGRGPNETERARGEALVRGYLAFGLYERAYETAMTESANLTVEVLEEVSQEIQRRGLLIESLRLMNRARSKREFVLTRRRAEILYPQPFSVAMEEVAEREELDLPIFYGLVREESHFSADIISSAGATGLSQLMPATAEDMARRMRLTEPDLTDPFTNLTIGAFYLSHLLERFDDGLLPALAAYNGGQGRVRRWLQEYESLSGPFFHESIPFRETRQYIRKILVSAAYYGEIYDRRTIAETVRLFYPEMESLPESQL